MTETSYFVRNQQTGEMALGQGTELEEFGGRLGDLFK